MSGPEWDAVLWWLMLSAGIIAATLSIVITVLDRRQADWPTHRQRFVLHLVSYGFMTVSVATFVLRGLLVPA